MSAGDTQPVTIKKYANRRLYNTGTSTYVTLEDLAGLDAPGAEQPVSHPPGSPIRLQDVVGHPPDEGDVLVGAGPIGGQVRAALGDPFERLVDEREGMTALMREDHGVERATARVAGPDADGQAGDVRVRSGRPSECVRGQLSTRSDELAEGPPVHSRDVGGGCLDERAFQYLDLHSGRVVDPR